MTSVNKNQTVDPVHIPVLMDEVLTALAPKAGEVIVDGTFGAGGYSRNILDAADCKLFGIDRDPDAIIRAEAFKAEFGDRFDILKGCFGNMDQLLADAGEELVDGVVLDIGVSSYQLNEAHRGFSFQADGPLDMRMGDEGKTAADIVNTYEQDDIANIIYNFGEEKKAYKIASAILRAREEGAITTTSRFAEVVGRAVGYKRVKGKKMIHPATRTFQALRIYINDELGELERGLYAAERLLKPGGRLVVVAFHSLEDRIVKQFMAERSGRISSGSRHMPMIMDKGPEPTFHLKKKGAVKPTDEEATRNPRSRSAKLRVAERTDAPAQAPKVEVPHG